MRLLVCRWGVVVAILGLPLLGRGLATMTALPTIGGIALVTIGGLLFAVGRLAQPRV